MKIKTWQEKIHEYAKDKGFYDKKRNIPEMLALIHSEVSEALEDYRRSEMTTYFKEKKPCGFASELADIVIRVFDLAEYLGIDLEKEMKIKHKYNLTRERKHGKKI